MDAQLLQLIFHPLQVQIIRIAISLKFKPVQTPRKELSHKQNCKQFKKSRATNSCFVLDSIENHRVLTTCGGANGKNETSIERPRQ